VAGLYVVATPIGNLDDLSPRAVETLGRCGLIAAEDTRHTGRLLQRLGVRTRLISYHKFNERQRLDYILRAVAVDRLDVALVCNAGTPGISDPGRLVVAAARERGIPVLGIPGPSAAATALSISGFPAQTFHFFGFLPRGPAARLNALRGIQRQRCETFVLYESPHRIGDLARLLAETFPRAQACFCRELTKLHEASYYGSIDAITRQLADDPQATRGEYTVVVHADYEAAEEHAGDAGPTAAAGGDRAELTPEALLVDALVRHDCTLKQAVKLAASETGRPRNEFYQASLNLKRLLEI